MDKLLQLIDQFTGHLFAVLSYPIKPGERIFWLYLISSLLFALGVYLWSPQFKQDREAGTGLFKGLFRFLFPSKVWSHKSAWVDVRYFIPHQFVRLWIYTDILGASTLFADRAISSLAHLSGKESIFIVANDAPWLVFGYALTFFLLLDFAGFYVHYLQHKIPLLWEFHKIHHSAQVLHPLSNYREHPVDNVAYGIATGITAGIVIAGFRFMFGVEPIGLLVPILGIHVLQFAYNLFGYNLRHSHIWVRWPGVFAYLFGCPAHHQIHHSCKPHHINKNFAFMFPIWDVLFGTYHLPKEEEELEIGLGDGTDEEYCSFLAMYSLPFQKLLKKYTQTLEKAQLQTDEDNRQDLSQTE